MFFDSIDKLTSAMAAGNEAAVELFYRRHFDWLYARARRATRRDEAFCLDVVQDAVLRIVRTVRKVESEAQFFGWMQLVVHTTALDHLRQESRRTKREAFALAIRAESTVEEPTSETYDEMQISWLTESLARFDPELVRMIEMRFDRNWSLRQIAESLGLTVGTVDGRLRRAIHDLRLRAAEMFDE